MCAKSWYFILGDENGRKQQTDRQADQIPQRGRRSFAGAARRAPGTFKKPHFEHRMRQEHGHDEGTACAVRRARRHAELLSDRRAVARGRFDHVADPASEPCGAKNADPASERLSGAGRQSETNG